VNYFHELQTALAGIDPTPLLDFIKGCKGTLWLAGNGGSASTAQHWACDLSKAAGRRIQALGSNPAVLTAWANDESYEEALAEELKVLSRPGDALIALSCSGTSLNISMVLGEARRKGMSTAMITMPESYIDRVSVDVLIKVPSQHYGVLEDCFSAIGHWLTEELQK
jgi:D-sedoheptulose 7-phosphate isomerase